MAEFDVTFCKYWDPKSSKQTITVGGENRQEARWRALEWIQKHLACGSLILEIKEKSRENQMDRGQIS